MDTLQAAKLLPKLKSLDDENDARQRIVVSYGTLLQDSGITLLHGALLNRRAWAQYTIRAQNRPAMQATLQEAGIPTAVHCLLPRNRQPAFAGPPPTCRAAAELLSLPMNPYVYVYDNVRMPEALAQAVNPA